MIRKIKALGLALVAMAALGAVFASGAQAAAGEIHITAPEKADITGHLTAGTQETLEFGGSTIQCKQATFEGTVTGQAGSQQTTATEVEVTPTYSECQGLGGLAAVVQMNGCKYTIKGVATLTAEGGVTGCTEGKKITINIGNGLCVITIGNQAGDLSHITFTNDAASETTAHHLQDHVTVSGIAAQRDNAFCPNAQTASYQGTTTIKAYKDKEDLQVTKHEHQYTEHVCGEEVGILAT